MIDPKDLLKRINGGTGMYPAFAVKLPSLLVACAARGAVYVPTSGIRTYPEQDALYARGRTSPPLGRGHVVTMARGGYSPHNFACACDATRHKGPWAGKLNPDYSDKAYSILAEEAEKLDLEPGLHWPNLPDAPHVQMPLRKHGISWAMMRKWYAAGGVENVFRELDARGPW